MIKQCKNCAYYYLLQEYSTNMCLLTQKNTNAINNCNEWYDKEESEALCDMMCGENDEG